LFSELLSNRSPETFIRFSELPYPGAENFEGTNELIFVGLLAISKGSSKNRAGK
jgi:hypothetical protein